MTPKTETFATLAAVFGRLFENEFATLDGISISCRTPSGMDYVDGTAGLSLWLGDEVTRSASSPADPAAYALHEACYVALPAHEAVISGWSRHLRALLLEGLGTPPSTSMMRNRGVLDMGLHLVEPAALEGPSLAASIESASALATRNGMRHALIITTEGLVVVSGAPAFEAMAHWHNIEFAARVECLRLEASSLSGREA